MSVNKEDKVLKREDELADLSKVPDRKIEKVVQDAEQDRLKEKDKDLKQFEQHALNKIRDEKIQEFESDRLNNREQDQRQFQQHALNKIREENDINRVPES